MSLLNTFEDAEEDSYAFDQFFWYGSEPFKEETEGNVRCRNLQFGQILEFFDRLREIVAFLVESGLNSIELPI